MLTLYQFPISHYCEKIRWALDYKQLDYQVVNLIPGLHGLSTRKLSANSAVPILRDGALVIQGSSRIITHLDQTRPACALTPETDDLKKEALEWEQFVDKEIGVAVRRCCYHILLDHPQLVIDMFTQQGPWYGKPFLGLMFPYLGKKMRQLMKINATTASQAKARLYAALDKLDARLQQQQFLVGTGFTRADLAAAALLAPLRMPEKYGLNWPDQIPPELQALIAEFEPRLAWVDRLYQHYR